MTWKPPEVWTCKVCGPLTPDKFGVYKNGAYFRIKCLECSKRKAKSWKDKNPERARKQLYEWRDANRDTYNEINKKSYYEHQVERLTGYRDVRAKRRHRVIEHYSGGAMKCALCPEAREDLLVIDHVNGGGEAHRKELKSASSDQFYGWVIRNKFPSGFRVLCHNCNHATIGGRVSPTRSYGAFVFPVLTALTPDARCMAIKRVTCLTHYGNMNPKCVCCGISNYELLTIDHVNGGGNKHRKEIGVRGSEFYRWLMANGMPDGYQVLCFNCNFARGSSGKCEHAECTDGS